MNTRIDPKASIGQLVADRPSRSRVFERLRIDYCCGGRITLEEACRTLGIQIRHATDLLEQCDALIPAADADRVAAATMSLSCLADHIEHTHHAHLRDELPRLVQLAARVSHAHGAREPHLHDLHAEMDRFAKDMFSHMDKEERVLFPAIRSLDRGERPSIPLASAIAMMEQEHSEAGDSMERMRMATSDFVPPSGACASYRALLSGLEQLVLETHVHVHKENGVLFPRAALAAERRSC